MLHSDKIMKIPYPYLPSDRVINYVSLENKYIKAAKEYAKEHSLDLKMPTGTVLVKAGIIIGFGTNGSDYHKKYTCKRTEQNIPTGQSYEICEGCHPKNHSEVNAIKDAHNNGHQAEGADLYLWGHWWCCRFCWQAIIKAGIKNVYLVKGSEKLFNKVSTDNIIGKQFV